jgi:mannosyltransferase OCH1-like enzyme
MVLSKNTRYILIGIFIVAIALYVFDDTLTFKMEMYDIPFHIPRKNMSGPDNIFGVPLTIYHSWSTNRVPTKMKENIYSLLDSNPEFDYYLYSDQACYEFIKTHFEKDVAEAFNALKPGAYKSDLWRYCILYVQGGVYIDIKYNTVAPLVETVKNSPTLYVNDRDIALAGVKSCFYNGFMISPPNNVVLKDCIDEIVENCKNRLYRTNPLDVTGPCLLGRMIQKHNRDLRKNNKYRFEETHMLSRTGLIMYENKRILKTYPEYRSDQEVNDKVAHYGQLWLKKDIYNL